MARSLRSWFTRTLADNLPTTEETPMPATDATPEPTWKATDPDAPTGKVDSPWGDRPPAGQDRDPDEQHDTIQSALEAARHAQGVHAEEQEQAGAQWETEPQTIHDGDGRPIRDYPLTTTGEIPVIGMEAEPAETCPHCGATMMTEQELVAASVDDLTATMHTVVPNMYRRLFRLAPHLIFLFEQATPDLIVWVDDPDRQAADGAITMYPGTEHETVRFWRVYPDAAQVGKVFGAIKATVALYDPHDPDKLEQLRGALNAMGRAHTRFEPPATIDEYAAVVTCVLDELAAQAGPLWTPRLEMAWRKRLEFVSGTMLAAQATAVLSGPGRRRRTV